MPGLHREFSRTVLFYSTKGLRGNFYIWSADSSCPWSLTDSKSHGTLTSAASVASLPCTCDCLSVCASLRVWRTIIRDIKDQSNSAVESFGPLGWKDKLKVNSAPARYLWLHMFVLCVCVCTCTYNNIYEQFLIQDNNLQNHHWGSDGIYNRCAPILSEVFVVFLPLNAWAAFSVLHIPLPGQPWRDRNHCSSSCFSFERKPKQLCQRIQIWVKVETVSHDGHAQPDTFKSTVFLSALTCVCVIHTGDYFPKYNPFGEQNVGLHWRCWMLLFWKNWKDIQWKSDT